MGKSNTVKIRRATVRHDGQDYDFVYGEDVSSAPKAVRDLLTKSDALGEPGDNPGAVGTVNPADATSTAVDPREGAADPSPPAMPESQGGSGGSTPPELVQLPDDAPDASTVEVITLAEYIDAAKDGKGLNAPETVALAQNQPDLAAKVIEAEKLAQGGDGRVTVLGPLEKLGDSAAT